MDSLLLYWSTPTSYHKALVPYDQTVVGKVDTQWLNVELQCMQTPEYSNVQAN